MEVASFVIGIATLAGLVESIEKTVRKINDVYDAPAAFQALLNEIAAFKTFLSDVEKLVTEGGARQSTIITESFRISVLRSKQCLDQINDTLVRCSTEGNTKVKRLRWVIKSKLLHTHTQNIRNARLEIIGALSIVSQTAAVQTSKDLGSLVASSMHYFNTIQQHFDQTQTPRTSVINFESTAQIQTNGRSGDALVPEDNISPLPITKFVPSTSFNSNYMMQQEIEKSKSPLQAGQILRQFTVCGCVCHKIYRFTTPTILLNSLGAVFIAHSGLPGVTRECNDPYCQQPATPFGSLTWYLPPWLLNMVATCVIANSATPELILRVSRVVLAGDDIFKYVQDGELSHLRQLFSRKQASPFDITATRGQSALQLAVLLNKLDICEFLLNENADPYLEDWEHISSCAFDIAWDRILGNTVDEDSRKRLRELFSNATNLEKRGFSKLHKTILDLLVLDLKEELSKSSSAAINKQDEEGKTPLAWAALKGDYSSVELLLGYESNVKISTRRGFTPLHFAAESGNLLTVKHLLAAGADVAVKNNRQESPLHLAARHHDNPELLKIFLNYNAELNCQAQFGYSPLIYAVQEDHVQNVTFLLEAGADVNIQDYRGFTALSFAIVFNRHKCMVRLLQSSADQTTISKRGRSLFHLVAMYADLDLMHILLAHLSPSLPSVQHACDRGYTAFDLALSRRSDTPEEWRNGFLNLLRLSEKA